MITKSATGKLALNKIYLYNFYAANKGILLLTIGWLIFKIFNFFDLLHRPTALYEPMNYFAKLLMSTIPHPVVFVTVAVIGLAICCILLVKPDILYVRIFLTFILLWVNLFQWSWGVESVVSYTLLFSHLYTMLVPFDSKDQEVTKIGHKVTMIKLFYAAILVTYTLSGVWKWIALVYKLVLKPEDVNWLSDSGALFNAVVSFRNYDFDYNWLLPFFCWPWLWKFAFLLMNTIQTFCLFAVNRIQLQPLVALAFVIFHIINSIMFATVFITAILVIIILFFPYHLFRKDDSEIVNYYKSELGSKFTIQYINGEIDTYTDFDAFRLHFYRSHPFTGGFLYLPGLRTLCSIGKRK